jgi:aspartokinase-like uncharacterized kinase
MRNIIIVGGGEAVERIRRQCQQHAIPDEAAHWLCIEQMSLNARRVHKILPEFSLATSLEEIVTADFSSVSRSAIIFDAAQFLREVEPNSPGTTLPATWDVTSDSIAARVAIVLAARELVLLKSASPPSENVKELAEIGYVDRFLPRLAGEIAAIAVVDLSPPGARPVYLSSSTESRLNNLAPRC